MASVSECTTVDLWLGLSKISINFQPSSLQWDQCESQSYYFQSVVLHLLVDDQQSALLEDLGAAELICRHFVVSFDASEGTLEQLQRDQLSSACCWMRNFVNPSCLLGSQANTIIHLLPLTLVLYSAVQAQN